MRSTCFAPAAILALILSCHAHPYGNHPGQAHSYDSKVAHDSRGLPGGAQQQYWWQGADSPFQAGAAQKKGITSGIHKTQAGAVGYHSSASSGHGVQQHGSTSGNNGCCQQALQQQTASAVAASAFNVPPAQAAAAAQPIALPPQPVAPPQVPQQYPSAPALQPSPPQFQQQAVLATQQFQQQTVPATQQVQQQLAPVTQQLQQQVASTAQQQAQQSFPANSQQANQVQAPSVPYPGCAAALKCVEEKFCDSHGTMVNDPVFLTPEQKEHRVPLMSCLNPETNIIGFCCRDPNYKDPWPADMPMPGMMPGPAAPVAVGPPAAAPVASVQPQPQFQQPQPQFQQPQPQFQQPQPQFQQPQPQFQQPQPQFQQPQPQFQQPQPQFQQPQPQAIQTVICSQDQECVPRGVCLFRWQATGSDPTKNSPACKTPVDGNLGVCCNRLPAAASPPAPQQQQISLPPPPPALPAPPAAVPVPQPSPSLPPQPALVQPPLPPQPASLEQSNTFPPAAPSIVIPPSNQGPPLQPDAIKFPQAAVSAQLNQALGDCGVAGGSLEFPWHSTVASENGTQLCSATLVGGTFAVTSAHCVKGTNPTSLRLQLGQLEAGKGSLAYREEPIAAVVQHPDFEDGSLFNDIALLMMRTSVLPDPNLNQICLPIAVGPVSDNCYVTGWDTGVLSSLTKVPVQKGQVSVIENRNCETLLQKTHLGKYFKLHQSFTCAAGQDFNRVCKVGSGSPLVCKKQDSQQFVLSGISSWSAGCDNQMPGVYTNLANFANWLQTEMNRPADQLVSTSNSAFQAQQQFQSQFGASAGYGR